MRSFTEWRSVLAIIGKGETEECLVLGLRTAIYHVPDLNQAKAWYTIAFEVSANGKKVHDFSLPSGYPVYCEGGGFGEAQDATAKISSKGTFTAKLPIYFAPTHDHEGFVKVTGKFGKKGHESGKVITEFSTSKTCNGTSQYTATAG